MAAGGAAVLAGGSAAGPAIVAAAATAVQGAGLPGGAASRQVPGAVSRPRMKPARTSAAAARIVMKTLGVPLREFKPVFSPGTGTQPRSNR